METHLPPGHTRVCTVLGLKVPPEEELQLTVWSDGRSLPVLAQWVLLGVVAVSDHVSCPRPELPPGVVAAPGQLGQPPAQQVIDTSEGLVENHHVLDVKTVRRTETSQLKLGIPPDTAGDTLLGGAL